MYSFSISDYRTGKSNGPEIVTKHAYETLEEAVSNRNACILSILEYKHYYYCHLVTRRNISGLHIDMLVQGGKQDNLPIVLIGDIEND